MALVEGKKKRERRKWRKCRDRNKKSANGWKCGISPPTLSIHNAMIKCGFCPEEPRDDQLLGPRVVTIYCENCAQPLPLCVPCHARLELTHTPVCRKCSDASGYGHTSLPPRVMPEPTDSSCEWAPYDQRHDCCLPLAWVVCTGCNHCRRCCLACHRTLNPNATTLRCVPCLKRERGYPPGPGHDLEAAAWMASCGDRGSPEARALAATMASKLSSKSN